MTGREERQESQSALGETLGEETPAEGAAPPSRLQMVECWEDRTTEHLVQRADPRLWQYLLLN